MTAQFGIIGNPLEHSFSAQFFTELFQREGIDAVYELYPLDSIADLPELLTTHSFTGLNITYPFKESIIPYLDALAPTAQQIGAVNVVHFHHGKSIGYNTDCLGFQQSLSFAINRTPNAERRTPNAALILGTGGAAKAIAFALQQMGIPYQYVSRNATRGISYNALTAEIIQAHKLIINCTPLGMSPLQDACPDIPYHLLTTEHLLYDVIYNPAQTLFLQQGKAHGARTINGLQMLIGQAQAAWQIWKA